MKRLLICITLVAIVISGCSSNKVEDSASTTGDVTYKLRLAGQHVANFPDTLSLERAAEKIAEKTDGHVQIKVYPANQLGDYIQVYEEVMKGTIDMACITAPSQWDPMAEIGYIPYLVTNYDEGKVVWTEGSYFYNLFDEIQAKAGVKLLAFFPDGFMGVGAAKFNTDKCFDFSMKKDTLLRIPALDSLKIMAETMGFRTTTLPYADLFPALQTGITDGWIGGGPQLNYDSFRDAIKYYIDYNYMNDLVSVFINKKLYDSMPQEYQDVISSVFKEESLALMDQRASLDEQALNDLESYGIKVVIPTQEERDAMASYMRENAWPKLEEKFGKEVMENLKADVEKLK